MSEEQPKVKGVAFRTIGLCFAERGQEARDRAIELMPKVLADGYRYHTLLAARAIGKLAARHDMSACTSKSWPG